MTANVSAWNWIKFHNKEYPLMKDNQSLNKVKYENSPVTTVYGFPKSLLRYRPFDMMAEP